MGAVARELAKSHQVTVLTSRSGELRAESMDGEVRVVRVPVFFRRELPVANVLSMLAYLPAGALRGLFMRPARSFDVINTHFVVPTGPVGQLLSAFSGVRNVLSVHGGDLYDPSKKLSPHRHRWLRAPIAAMLRSADSVVGQSRDTIARVRSLYGVTRPVELIPLAIERPPRIRDGGRAQFGIPAEAFVLASVGRLVPRKNTQQLVQLLTDKGLSKAHLLIVGEGPESRAIREAAQARGVSDRVHLLGALNDKDKFAALGAADIFVSTSQHEGFGLMFLEALACGLPIVCYDSGGQTDFLTSGITGHVVPLNHIESFARAVIDLQGSREKRERIAAHNLARAEGYFVDRCAQRYEALYENVAALRPAMS